MAMDGLTYPPFDMFGNRPHDLRYLLMFIRP